MMSASKTVVKPPRPDAPKVEWAVYCARRLGVPVFPCHPNGKTPIVDHWKEVASDNPIDIYEMWARNPDANIGCHMVDRLAIDIDRKPGKVGAASWEQFIQQYGGGYLENTLTQETPTGGLHLILTVDKPSKNTQHRIGRDIDTRADGGYILGAGSTIDGKAYCVVQDAEMLDAPDWLVAVVGSPRPRTEIAAEALVDTDTDAAIEAATHYLLHEAPEAIEGHGGDGTTFRVACRVRDFGISQEQCFTLMVDLWNDAKAHPPWEADELARKVENAYRYAQDPIGGKSADAEFDAVEIPALTPLPVRRVGDFVWAGPPPYVVRGLITRTSVFMLTGVSDAGKSPLALDIAIHVAQGRMWQGHRVRQGYVLHISTEGKATLESRMLAQRKKHDVKATDPIDFVSIDLDLRQNRRDAVRIVETVRQRAALAGCPPELIVIDTLSHVLAGGDESNPEHVRPLIKNLKWISEQTGAAVGVIHHPTKSGDSAYRGHSALINDIDTLIYVEFDEDTKIRTVTTPRIKDWERIEPLPYVIEVVELAKDEHGDPVTSVVVNWDVRKAEKPSDRPMSKNELDVLKACVRVVETALEAGAARLKGGVENPALWLSTTFVRTQITDLCPRLDKRRLSEALATLKDRGVIKTHGFGGQTGRMEMLSMLIPRSEFYSLTGDFAEADEENKYEEEEDKSEQ